MGFNEKSVIVLSNSCEKLYQVLSYPFWQSLHFFISFYTIHICYITNVYGAADIEIERLSGGFKQAQTHTNIILEEWEMNIYIECEKIYIKGIFSSIGSQNTFIVLYSCIYM